MQCTRSMWAWHAFTVWPVAACCMLIDAELHDSIRGVLPSSAHPQAGEFHHLCAASAVAPDVLL